MDYPAAAKIKTNLPLQSVISDSITDRQWDLFVQSNPSGFHEQTSGWAAAKLHEGWKPLRIIFWQDQYIRGGFQILIKNKRFAGAVGFLNKGPLLDSDDDNLKKLVISELKKTSRRFNLKVLIISPPGGGHQDIFRFNGNEFPDNKVFTIIDSTLEIDLRKSSDDLLMDLRKTLRNSVRRLEGLNLRRGINSELSCFYDLMLETCSRQGVSPNPSSLEILETLWENFSRDDMIRLYFIEREGEVIAGAIILLIRDRFIIWKIGWNGKYTKSNPNVALFWFTIMLAKEEGFQVFDFASVDLKTAEQIRDQKKIPEEIIRTPTFFKLGFGGEIVKLPGSFIYFPNALFRLVYKYYCKMLPLIPILPRARKND